jgi:hypothetical protein
MGLVVALPLAPTLAPQAAAGITFVLGGWAALNRPFIRGQIVPSPRRQKAKAPPFVVPNDEPTLAELIEDYLAGARVPVGFPQPPHLPPNWPRLAAAIAAGAVGVLLPGAQAVPGLWGLLNSRQAPVPRGTWPVGHGQKIFFPRDRQLVWTFKTEYENFWEYLDSGTSDEFIYDHSVGIANRGSSYFIPWGNWDLEYSGTAFPGGRYGRQEEAGIYKEPMANWEPRRVINEIDPRTVVTTTRYTSTETTRLVGVIDDVTGEILPPPDFGRPGYPPRLEEGFVAPLPPEEVPQVVPLVQPRPSLIPEVPPAVRPPFTPGLPEPVPPAPQPPGTPAPGFPGVRPRPGIRPGLVPTPGVPVPQPPPWWPEPTPPTVNPTDPVVVPVTPVIPGVRPTLPDGAVAPVPAPLVKPTAPGTHVVDNKPVPSNPPKATLAGIAREVGRIEWKTAQLLRGGGGAPNWADLAQLLQRIWEMLQALNDVGEYTLGGPCELDADGNPIPITDTVAQFSWGGNASAIANVASRVDALAQMIQYHKLLRQPSCKNPRPVGEWVTVNFEQVD